MGRSDVCQPIDTILDGSNFEVWSKDMSSFLERHKLWRYVTGEIPRPVKYRDEDEIEYNGRLKDWENKNRKILTWFRITTSVNLPSATAGCETAKEAWDILSKRYFVASQYQLCKELCDLRQSSGQSIKDFLSKMEAIWDQLALSEPKWSCPEDTKKFTKYQQKMRVVQFLMALDKDYEPVRTRLLEGKDFPEFDSVLHELLSEETRLRNDQTNSSSVAKSTSTGSPRSTNSPKDSSKSSGQNTPKVRNKQKKKQSNRSRSSLLASSVVNDQVHRDPSSSPSSKVLSTTTGIRAETSGSTKSHWSHLEHPLEMVVEGSYNCNGCKMDGVGRGYRCGRCDFNLHKECMEASLEAEITVQGLKCEFLKKPKDLWTPERPMGRGFCEGGKCFCEACGMIVEGFVYRCSESKKNFHPRCAKLPPEILAQRDVKFTLQKEVCSKCQFCNKKRLPGTEQNVRGWLYASSKNKECAFHVYCVMNVAMQHMEKLTGTGGKDLPFALEEWEQLLKIKSKRITGGGTAIEWGKIMKRVSGTVFSILLGDPTTMLATAVANTVTEVLLRGG